jgi:hypothetical protein
MEGFYDACSRHKNEKRSVKIKNIIVWLLFSGFSLGAIWFFTSVPSLPESQVADTEPWLPQAVQESDQLLLDSSRFLLKGNQQEVSSIIRNIQDLKIKLLGIVEENGQTFAIVNLNKENYRFMAGDSLPDGSVIDAIVDCSIMIVNNGDVTVLPLYQQGKEKK